MLWLPTERNKSMLAMCIGMEGERDIRNYICVCIGTASVVLVAFVVLGAEKRDRRWLLSKC